MGKDTKVQAIAKGTSSGTPASVVNTLQTETVSVFLHLQWKDPEGTLRDFPENFEVTPVLLLAGGTKQVAPVQKVKKEGRLSFVLSTKKEGEPLAWTVEKFSLKFDTTAAKYIQCEKRKATKKSCAYVDQRVATTPEAGALDSLRAFELPLAWSMVDSDWTVESTAEPKSYVAADKEFIIVIDDKRHDVGKKDTPVKMTLDPHWQFLRWIYYDRWLLGDDRISIPQIWIEGVADPTLPLEPRVGFSNWNHGGEADGKKAIQCLPWIIQEAGKPKPDATIMIRFTTKANTFIHSKDDGSRVLVDGVARNTANVERLRYYDLPALWRSTKYYARMTGPEKEDRFEVMVTEATTKDRPLVFSLDDIVLVDKDLKPITWVPDDRVAIISHLFDDKNPNTGATEADLSNTGVYKPDSAADMDYFTTKPVAPAIEIDRNYIAEYPDWTRVLATQGNLFDVFDKRTKDSTPRVADEVVGARAAVRWIDATATTFGGTANIWNAGPVPPAGWVGAPDGLPTPGRFLSPRPARIDTPFFHIQPYYEQRTGVRYRAAYDPANDEGIGRYDMALVRCCNVAEKKEVAVNLHFFRFSFTYNAVPAIGQATFENKILQNVNNRWNGKDTVNTKRAFILSTINKPLTIPVIWFGQALPKALSQFEITVNAASPNARDNRGAFYGSGESQDTSFEDHGTLDGFASAHENGHADALPDEYNERWDGASYGQLSFKSNLPADPYEPDGREVEFQTAGSPMMNGNATMRNRYFWHSAEFVRHCMSNLPFKVSYDTFTDFVLPPHEGTKRSYAWWPLQHKRDFTPTVIAPRTVTRGKIDIYVNAMGKEKFSVDSLPGKEAPAGTKPYDGIMTVIVKLLISLPGYAAAVEENERKLILQAIAGTMRKLNNKFYAVGKVRDKTPQKWEFKRCLIHFSPRFTVWNFVHPTDATFASDIVNIHGWHFFIKIRAAEPPVTEWTATPVVAELITADDWIAKIPATRVDESTVKAVKTDIGKYHAAPAADSVKRLAALTPLIGRDTKFPEKQKVRDDWTKASAGPGRGALEGSVDTALGNYEGGAAVDLAARINLLDLLVGACDNCIGGLDATDKNEKKRIAAATALKERAGKKKTELEVLKAVRELDVEAKARKEYIEKIESSNRMNLQFSEDGAAPARDVQIADAFFAHFLSMLGIYKAPADLKPADLLPLVKQVITTGADVKKI